ncbi:MAG: zf-HC2 domain-containing protein [Candidatus Sumerlaeaceae bacterium]|nr:zf-HC2 domain-containing protein [Candidatus Sumerlaeaceae bacterium]
MAFLDGELDEELCQQVRAHIENCPACRRDFQKFASLSSLTHQVKFSEPRDRVWDYYYRGVCHKMAGRSGLQYWALGSLTMVMVGNLMLFAFSHNLLGLTLGVVAIMAGLSMLWMSYFCNCKR